jgi:hypothetical protein
MYVGTRTNQQSNHLDLATCCREKQWGIEVLIRSVWTRPRFKQVAHDCGVPTEGSAFQGVSRIIVHAIGTNSFSKIALHLFTPSTESGQDEALTIMLSPICHACESSHS